EGATTLTVPFPTQATSLTPNLPGLSAGTVQVQVWQQTGASSFNPFGSAALKVGRARGGGGSAPASVNVAVRPARFTITGTGFTNLGFRLPVVNFVRGTTLLAQARAIALTSTTLTVPFPTTATTLTPNLPGLSAGTVQVQVWQQTGASSFSPFGSATL